MKRLASLPSSTEAHLLGEALRGEGIAVRVQENPPGLVPGEEAVLWLEDGRDEERARALLAEMRPRPAGGGRGERAPRRSPVPVLLLGVALGVVLAQAGARLWGGQVAPQESWDSDGDGRADGWARYSDGQLAESSWDRNFDGEPDLWQEYEQGRTIRAHYDNDFDGEPDHWEEYQDGVPRRYRTDNDRDGRPDEWGMVREGQVAERSWSYRGDEIVDKRAFYRAGRRVREEHDRDRDGRFEEIVHLDEFERPIRRERPD